MSIPPDLWKLIETLPIEDESQHFIIRYGYRNQPTTGRGMGADGVRDRVLILTYLHALENLYRTMRAAPWNHPAPNTGRRKRTRVFVCDSDPITSYDDDRVPCIVLSSRSDEPTTHAELGRAAAEAVHEATHLFNFEKRPHYETSSDPWVWFDEGIAVLMETLVVAGNPDYFRFLRDWIDAPDMPLDEPEEKYQTGMFINYLYRTLGPQFINKVWIQSLTGEGPLEALTRIAAGQNLTFLSANPKVRDIFASGYCMDPYFMWDHGSVSLAPDLFFRFGDRAIAETFTLDVNERCEVSDYLNHLSCRYYRFNLKSGVTKLTVEMAVEDNCQTTPLKAEVAFVTPQMQRERVEPLLQAPGQSSDEGCQMSVVLSPLEEKKLDHLVLVISNCGTQTSVKYNGTNHADDKFYVIRARAE
jgi:hypothetical protein